MPTEHFSTQEELDDAFEDLMSTEQRKAELKTMILQKEYDIECLEFDLEEEKSNLKELQEELEELNS